MNIKKQAIVFRTEIPPQKPEIIARKPLYLIKNNSKLLFGRGIFLFKLLTTEFRRSNCCYKLHFFFGKSACLHKKSAYGGFTNKKIFNYLTKYKWL